MKIMIRIFMAVCICLMSLVPVQAADYQYWSFQLTDGRTITADEYHEKTIVFIFYSAETDAEGNAVNANSAEVLEYLSTDPFAEAENTMTVAAAVEDKTAAEVDAFIDKYGRSENIYYAYNAMDMLDKLVGIEDGMQYTVCALYTNGQVTMMTDYMSPSMYEIDIKKELGILDITYFGLQLKVTFHQDLAREMLDLVNEFRTGDEAWYWNKDNTEKVYAENLNTLVYDYELEKAAMQRAAEVAYYFAHGRADMKTYFDTLEEMGITDVYVGENLITGTSLRNVRNALAGLKESGLPYQYQGHRRNMLNEKHVSCAFACAEYNGLYYWVQEFSYGLIGDSYTPVNTNTETRTIHACDIYTVGWKMEKETLDLAPGTSGKISKINALTISPTKTHKWEDQYRKVENVLSWTSSNEDVISVSGDSFTAKKTGTAVLTAVTPDPSVKVQFTVNVKDEDEGPIITPEPTPAVKTVEMYRLYNPNSGEHFYTAKSKERDALVKVGWKYEGIGWYAPETSKTPVYRLYNENAGDHHYTMKKAERDALIKIGWKDEKIGWYSDDNEEVPLYRQYNPNAVSGSHNYTTNKKENDALVKIGWIAEGIGWYGVKH